MATTKLQTRILNKISTWTEWENVKSTFKPLRGEICIVEIPSGTSSTGLTPPATGIKVGDGQHFFGDLPWIQAVAGDVTAWCKENMADFDKFKAQVAAAVADSEGGLQDAIDGLSQRVTNLEATVNTGDNSNAKLRQAITDVNSIVSGHTTELGQLTTNKADKTQVATDIAAAKTAVLGEENYSGTVKGAYEAATIASNAADAASAKAQTGIDNAATAQAAAEAAQTRADNAYSLAETANGTANTNASEISTIKEDIADINNLLGGSDGTSVSERLTALETTTGEHTNKIQDNTDAINAEKTRAEGVEAGLRTDVDKVLTFFDVDPAASTELVDTLRELQEYIASDETGAATMAGNIQANTSAIAAEVERATKAENTLQNNIDSVKNTLLGGATEGTDTIASVKAAAVAADKKADENLDTAKTYAESQAAAVLGNADTDAAGTTTVHGALKSAAAAASAAVTAQNTANAADTLSKANQSVIDSMTGSSTKEEDGVISVVSFSENKLTATHKKIDMDDMSDTATFIFDCGNASRDA